MSDDLKPLECFVVSKRGRPELAEKCDVPLTCFVTAQLSKDVYRESRRQRISVSAFMRRALQRHVEISRKTQQKN